MNHRLLSIPVPRDAQRVRQSDSSWIDRFEDGGQAYYAKTYVYRWPYGPLRGLFRNTFLAPSRATREDRALRHLAARGVQPDLAIATSERRVVGFLTEARLLTRDFGGEDLATHLISHRLVGDDLHGLARFVRALHETGLRDPDLLCRNLLLRRAPAGQVEWAKIDASASTIGKPSCRFDRRRRRDLAGLVADLARHGATRRQLLAFLAAQWFPVRASRCQIKAILRRSDAAR